MEFQKTVIKQLADMKQKLNIIIIEQRNWMDLYERKTEKTECEIILQIDDDVKKIMASLPISTDDELTDVEAAIVNIDCFQKLVSILCDLRTDFNNI